MPDQKLSIGCWLVFDIWGMSSRIDRTQKQERCCQTSQGKSPRFSISLHEKNSKIKTNLVNQSDDFVLFVDGDASTVAQLGV